MKFTNKLGLPKPIVDAVIKDPYTKGESDISITGLIAPARIRVLKKIHEAELVEDVSERIFSLLGQVMHGILERAAGNLGEQFADLVDRLIRGGKISKPLEKLLLKVRGLIFNLFPNALNTIFEKRWYLKIDGINVSGQSDAYYDEGLVQDYKLVSLYQVKDGVKPEFEDQLNCYAHLLRENGLKVKKLELVCILRDWTKSKAKHDRDMPQQQVVKLDVPLWSPEKALEFITQRVKIHKDANSKLPLCTDEERWATPDKWAVMPKKNAVRSLKNHLTEKDAIEHAANVSGAFVEFRPGENKRCQDYCSVAQFCTQYKKLKEKK